MNGTSRFVLFFLLLGGSRVALAQAPDPALLKHAAEVNSLTAEGKLPFYLSMSFQLYDLDGKASEAGTIDEWWVSRGVSRLVVKSPSLNISYPTNGVREKTAGSREQYLIDELIAEELDPVPDLGLSRVPVAQSTRSFGTVQLSCLSPKLAAAGPSNIPPMTYCVDPKTYALGAKFANGMPAITHNSPGVFHGTAVALDLQISYQDKLAITGKVVGLKSFDAAHSDVELTHPSPSPDQPAGMATGVTAGKIINRVQPTYPAVAKAGRIQGAVILHGVISKSGAMLNLFPISSSSGLLTGAAVDAAKQWTYSPFLLNGAPTDVDTVVVVNFFLNR